MISSMIPRLSVGSLISDVIRVPATVGDSWTSTNALAARPPRKSIAPQREKIVKRQIVRTASPYEVSESFARAVVFDNWVYVSQCAGIVYDTQELPSTVEGQTNQALDNVENALKAAGASFGDVVRRMVMIPNVDHAEQIMGIVGERFRGLNPTNVVFCTPLGAPQYLLEIEVTAYRGIGSAETETITI